MRRHSNLALWCRNEHGRIGVDHLLATEISQEGADRRELARSGRTREPLLVKRAEKCTDRDAIERARRKLGSLDVARPGDVIEELREIAVVRTNRVRRHVAVQAQMLEEV